MSAYMLFVNTITYKYPSNYASGSEIYQETLIKALAKHFGAILLVVDLFLLPDILRTS